MKKFKRKICLRCGRSKGKPSMLAQMTCIIVHRGDFIETEIEVGGGLVENISTQMAKTLVPEVGGDGGEAADGRVKVTIRVASEITVLAARSLIEKPRESYRE
jgi:hypothetical protein